MGSTSTFDRSRIVEPDNINSVITKNLAHSMASYHAVMQADKRGVSPQFQSFESSFKMWGKYQAAPSEDGNQAIHGINRIRAGYAGIPLAHPCPTYVNIEPITLNNVQCYWITHPSQRSWKHGNFIVYYHGMIFIALYLLYCMWCTS